MCASAVARCIAKLLRCPSYLGDRHRISVDGRRCPSLLSRSDCSTRAARPKVALDPRGVELLRRIERAFSDWPPSDGLTWVQAEMLDNREPDEILREGAHIGVYE